MSQKRILYLSYYFEPDVCAGSFRNTPLAKTLAASFDGVVEVVTTHPNRYQTFKVSSKDFEANNNLVINRIKVPEHSSGFLDQIKSFYVYYKNVMHLTKEKNYDLVFASSSRLFTAFLGARISAKKKVKLYLDIRDIFVDTMEDVLKNKLLKSFVIPSLKRVERYTFSKAAHINLISGGFKPYFSKYKHCSYSQYPNGIDDLFVNTSSLKSNNSLPRKIVYAGNIGEGQGLHNIIPEMALQLGENYLIEIIGDGGARHLLERELKKKNAKNVVLKNPVKRNELPNIYKNADYLFLHLNDYDAFKKVLPSKVFEYGAVNKPIIAGVSGFSADFINENITNAIVFKPCDVSDFITKFEKHKFENIKREDFIKNFSRDEINKKMSYSILQTL